MSRNTHSENGATGKDAATGLTNPGLLEIRKRITDYWQCLGIQDSQLLETLTEDCLQRARKQSSNPNGELLARRAIEEASKNFDRALNKALLTANLSVQTTAREKAALLLNAKLPDMDKLLTTQQLAAETQKSLTLVMPNATPPEQSQNMPHQRLSFFSIIPFRKPQAAT